MKKNQTKALTTLQLIVIVVIIGLIITGILIYFNNQRKRNYITMAKQYISSVRLLATEDRIILPETRDVKVLISISKIDESKKLNKSSFNEKWISDKSYIIIKNEGTEYSPIYRYYIALEDEGGNCMELTEETKLNRNSVTKKCNIDKYNETKPAYIE